MDYFKQFKTYISNNNYPAYLSLWEEYCASDEIDGEELKFILESVKETPMKDSFGRYVEHILPLWETIEDETLAHQVLCLIFDLQNTNTKELADFALDYLKKHFENEPLFLKKLRLVGLRDGVNFQGAISNFTLLNHMKKHNFVFHTGGWGVGEIMDISLLREQLSLEFDYVSGQKDFSFENAFNTLIPIPNDHFLAMRFGNPDKLESIAKKDPLFVIHKLLKDLGPKTAAEIKDELSELVLQPKEWTRWWQTTRTKLKKDTLIEVPDSLQEPFVLRKSEVPHEETLQKALDKKPDAQTLIQLVYSFIRDFPQALKNQEFKKHLEESLRDVLNTKELNDTQELQILFFLEDLSDDAYPPVSEMIQNLSSIIDLVLNIEIVAFKKRTLTNIRKCRSDWVDIFAELLLSIDQNPLRDYIFQELMTASALEPFKAKMEILIKHPQEHPGAILWYIQKVMRNHGLPYGDQEGKNRLFEAFLILYHKLEQRKETRDILKKMYTFLTTARFANVRKIFQNASQEDLQEFLLLATKCHTVSDHDKKILHSLAEVVHPSLAKLSKKYGGDRNEDVVIWTTEEGFNKLKNNIHHIATVETVENAKQIEIARSYGDLRENAEYKAAKEQRSRLQSELKRLSTQLNQTRILTKEDVAKDEISVGAIVHFENERGEKVTYTILGPYDADPEQNIISFQSKLAEELIGKRCEDSAIIKNEPFTVKAIENYFEK
ncbi:MAG: GreA/GreB family elongation factor [Simkaniaceae bacterium]